MSLLRRRRVFLAGLAVGSGLLAVPALAKASGADVDWSSGDFLLAAALLAGLSAALDAIWTGGGDRSLRLARTIAFVTALFLLVANLAVGVVRDESHPANLLSFLAAILAIGGGALLLRTPPLAMACLLLAAGVQATMPFIAIAVWSLPVDAGMARSAVFSVAIAAGFATAVLLARRRELPRSGRTSA